MPQGQPWGAGGRQKIKKHGKWDPRCPASCIPALSPVITYSHQPQFSIPPDASSLQAFTCSQLSCFLAFPSLLTDFYSSCGPQHVPAFLWRPSWASKSGLISPSPQSHSRSHFQHNSMYCTDDSCMMIKPWTSPAQYTQASFSITVC